MTELEKQAVRLIDEAHNASQAERLRLQPQIDRIVTTMMTNGHRVPSRVRQMNNVLKDEALDDMFDNMPV